MIIIDRRLSEQYIQGSVILEDNGADDNEHELISDEFLPLGRQG